MGEFQVSFAIISLVWIVTRSKIMAPIRSKLNFYLLSCDQCLAFWFGLLLSGIFTQEKESFLIIWWSVSGFGFLSSKIFPNTAIKKKNLPPIGGLMEE